MRAITAWLLAGAIPIAAPAQTAPAPVRTLVYAFESRAGQGGTGPDNGERPAGEIAPDDCLSGGLKIAGRMSAAVAAGNGGIDWFQVDCKGGFGYQLGANGRPERGTIQVVAHQQADGTLVVQLSEKPGDGSPATCVVFPSTALICDPNKTVSLEAVTLLRFLAPDLIDPSRDRPHWQFEDGGSQSSFKASYTILQKAAGVMTIAERRTATGDAGPNSTSDSSSTFLYDLKRAIPMAIDENLVQKTVQHGRYGTMKRETVFRLQQPY
jgi:hypothetical protein